MKMNLNTVFEVVADGQRNGISVAVSQQQALENAVKARTRQTVSKIDGTCDFVSIGVRPLGSTGPWLLSNHGKVITDESVNLIRGMFAAQVVPEETLSL